MSLVIALLGALRASLRTRTDLPLENLALRQKLVLLRRRSKRSQFGASIGSSGCISPTSGGSDLLKARRLDRGQRGSFLKRARLGGPRRERWFGLVPMKRDSSALNRLI